SASRTRGPVGRQGGPGRAGLSALAYTAAALVACESSPATEGLVASRIDTVAGVVEVTNPPVVPRGRLEPVAAFGSAGTDGEPRPDVFGSVASVVADATGNVWVADAQTREIRVFDRSGAHLRMVGRQ